MSSIRYVSASSQDALPFPPPGPLTEVGLYASLMAFEAAANQSAGGVFFGLYPFGTDLPHEKWTRS
jgi:hypothetical protein